MLIPSMLARGNLPSIPELERYTWHHYTAAEDAPYIEASASWQRLEALMPVELHRFDPEVEDNKYIEVTRAHMMASNVAHAAGAMLVYLCPDFVIADGSFANVDRLARGQWDAVMLGACLRLSRETAVDEILARWSADGSVIEAPPRELATMIHHSLHPVSAAMFYENPQPLNAPSVTFFGVGEECVLVHAFHLHPLVVRPIACDPNSDVISIDEEFIAHVKPESVYVIQDSDECMVWEIAPNDILGEMWEYQRFHDGFHISRLVDFAMTRAHPIHRKFFPVPCFMHTGDLSVEQKFVYDLAPQRVVRKVLQAVELLEAP